LDAERVTIRATHDSDSDRPNAEALLERLRELVADPDLRTDYRPSVFDSSVRSMSLGELFSTGRSVFGDLMKVVASNQAGLPPGRAD
jgi:hypothetical protein